MNEIYGMVMIAGNFEAGEVVKENNRTALLRFEKLHRQPILKFKKKRIQLILGDRWKK